MKRYTFGVTLVGEGENENEAWTNAVDAFTEEPGEPDICDEDTYCDGCGSASNTVERCDCAEYLCQDCQEVHVCEDYNG